MNVQDVREVVHAGVRMMRKTSGEFHAHTNMSTMDALPEVENSLRKQPNGDWAVAITDHEMFNPSLMVIRQLRKLASS